MVKGRPSKYDVILNNLDYIKEELEKGTTESEIAKSLKISYSTWNNYKTQGRPEFMMLFKDVVVARVETKVDCDNSALVEELKNKLVKKAMGYTVTTTKYQKCKAIEYDSDTGKKLREYEKMVEYEEETYYPSDTNAILNALNIYDKSYVRDRAAHTIKLREIELKEKNANKEDW